MQAKEKQTLDLETLKKRMNRLKRSSDQCKCRWRSGEENLFAMMKAFKVVVATRSTVGGHGAVRHAFAEVHPHVVATPLLACHPKSWRHLCAMRMLPEARKTKQTHNLCLTPFTSRAWWRPSRHVPCLYPLGLPNMPIPVYTPTISGYTWRVSLVHAACVCLDTGKLNSELGNWMYPSHTHTLYIPALCTGLHLEGLFCAPTRGIVDWMLSVEFCLGCWAKLHLICVGIFLRPF